jgi:hypothetical protein
LPTARWIQVSASEISAENIAISVSAARPRIRSLSHDGEDVGFGAGGMKEIQV